MPVFFNKILNNFAVFCSSPIGSQGFDLWRPAFLCEKLSHLITVKDTQLIIFLKMDICDMKPAKICPQGSEQSQTVQNGLIKVESQSIFQMNIFYSHDRNYTFGTGENWIKCSGQPTHSLVYQVQLLLLLSLHQDGRQVTKDKTCMQIIEKEFLRFINFQSRRQTRNSQNQTKQRQYQLSSFVKLVSKIQYSQSLHTRIHILCALINQNPPCHKIIFDYLSFKLFQYDFAELNKRLHVKFQWKQTHQSVMLDQIYQSTFRIDANGVLLIKINKNLAGQPPKNINESDKEAKEINNVIKKVRVSSPENTDYNQFQKDYFKAKNERLSERNHFESKYPKSIRSQKNLNHRKASYSTSVEESSWSSKNSQQKNNRQLKIHQQYALSFKPLVFRNIQHSLTLKSKIPQFLMEKKCLQISQSSNYLQSSWEKQFLQKNSQRILKTPERRVFSHKKNNIITK